MDDLDPRLLLISPEDNIAVLRANVRAGEALRIGDAEYALGMHAGYGHKIAVRPIATGEKVLKYGAPVGSATRDIAVGDYVHIHNMQSDYIPTYTIDGENAYLKRREAG